MTTEPSGDPLCHSPSKHISQQPICKVCITISYFEARATACLA